jgi:2-desacetyl-2-hydroxyethyl bacteriochlorophyllide A dehydrogenase
MMARTVVFVSPHRVELQTIDIGPPGPGEVLVQVRLAAISAGTEMLIYRGLAPSGMQADATLPSLPGTLRYPLRYGYASVGIIADVGSGVEAAWMGRRVFGFQPHATHFCSPLEHLLPLPDSLDDEDAVFIPNTETALSLIQDGRPVAGEEVVIFGQGILGLLVTSLLGSFPQGALYTVDRHAMRRQASIDAGATQAFDPMVADLRHELGRRLFDGGADLAYELSGDPAALDEALALTGFAGRVILGSWYGARPVQLALGSEFHRRRIQLMSSQVSRIDPSLTGRWTKERRLAFVLQRLSPLAPRRWITHRFPLDRASEAYHLLESQPEQALQVVFTPPERD